VIWRSEFAGQVCREQAYGKRFAVGFSAVAVGFRPAANKLIPVVKVVCISSMHRPGIKGEYTGGKKAINPGL
jgi:hypothetical protein